MTSSAWLRVAARSMRAAIVARRDPADRDVVAGAEVVADEILEDDAHVAAQRVEIVFAQVVAIEQDAAFVRIVEPGQKLHQRGLAGAVLADQREHLAGAQREAEMAHRPSLGAGIAEPDVFEHEARADRLRETDADWPATGSPARPRRTKTDRRDRAPGRPCCEKLVSSPSSSVRRRRNEPARKVRSPTVNSPVSVRQAM